MMSFLRGSASYVWCTTSVLGKGATGAVFQGVNKQSGEAVAVKTFNQLSHMRPQEVQMREFEVLQKVNHENIVKLLAIEEEQEGRGKVIVMELCTGGSLFNLLDDPENNFGLPEDEFVLVLSHLSSGMNHLRDNNLVHRDLKPGNIMKFIDEAGNTIYKLTDFGAARELQDGQQFVSLYGTEEYLHPDMYERAVLRKPVGKSFGATVDLWSIGVTLYHVATGNLPFRPFGGRRNKETMYHITTQKASGVISGVQVTENGPIQWSTELPATSLLSQGIRKHVTPLLAGLLEVDAEKRWSFEHFFAQVTRILSKKKLHLFLANEMRPLRVYLDRKEMLEHLQLHIQEQTHIESQHQILLYQENLLTHYVEADTVGTSYPETNEHEKSIFILDKSKHQVRLENSISMPTFPTLPNLVSVENDATLAKSACAVGYAHKRRVEKFALAMDCSNKVVSMLNEVIVAMIDRLDTSKDTCEAVASLTESQLRGFENAHRTQTQLLNMLNVETDGKEWRRRTEEALEADSSRFRAMRKRFDGQLRPAIVNLKKRYCLNHALIREWKEATRELPSLSPCAARADTNVKKLKESWQHLLRDRASRTLTYNDEQFHILEKIKMQETMRTMADLLNNEATPVIGHVAEQLADWYKMAQAVFIQTEILIKDMHVFEEEMELLAVAIKTSQDASQGSVEQIMGQLRSEHVNSSADHEPKKDLRDRNETKIEPKVDVQNDEKRQEQLVQITSTLGNLMALEDEVWTIIQENSRLIEQFGQMAVGDVESLSLQNFLNHSAQDTMLP